ncbi:diguanylate cyclase [Marinobacter sp.]|uniref:sensor domain-containing diguanylate cyclase n=1 Tax=Marinobacter sp. TaxID=50741 RepID=UPI00384B445C
MTFDDVSSMINLIPDAAILISREQMIVVVNPKAAEMFDTTLGKLEGKPLSSLVPHPAKLKHQQYVEGFFDQPKSRPMGSGMKLNGQREDGSIFPVDIMINRVEIAGAGYAIGIIRDDSDRVALRTMKEALELANARLARAQDVGGLGWWEVDQRQNQLTWSAMIPRILGVPETITPSFRAISELCVPEDKEHLDAFRSNLEGRSGERITYRIQQPDGNIRWIEETINQEPYHRVLGVMRDVTWQKRLEQRLRAESVTDPLTRLFNRRQFNRDLKARYAKFTRSGVNGVLVVYDFDYFKRINDRYGHAMGDEVLRESSTLVNSQLRAYDHAYRLGGEEFAILLNGVTTRETKALAERIRQSIEAACFRREDARVQATISLGVAQFRESDNRYDDVMRRADAALYESKVRSRNALTYTE